MDLSREFWTKVYEQNAGKMLAVCCRYVKDLEIAEDLVHDAFLKALTKSDSYTGAGCIEAWLRKITVNTALMYLRNNKSKQKQLDDLSTEKMSPVKDEVEATNIRSIIEQADFTTGDLLDVIHQLPEHHRLVFNLYVMDRYTHVQIGKELDISVGTSKSHLARARKKIQEMLFKKASLTVPEQRKKKRVLLWIFVLSSKTSYVDRLYRTKLVDFSLPKIYSKQDRFLDSIPWGMVNLPPKRQAFVFRYKYCLFSSLCILLLAFYLFRQHQRHEEPVLKQHPIQGAGSKSKQVIAPQNKPDDPTSKSVKMGETEEVIEQVIVQHKTITIKDTIHIIDTTNAQ